MVKPSCNDENLEWFMRSGKCGIDHLGWGRGKKNNKQNTKTTEVFKKLHL